MQPNWQEITLMGNSIGIFLGIFGDLFCSESVWTKSRAHLINKPQAEKSELNKGGDAKLREALHHCL